VNTLIIQILIPAIGLFQSLPSYEQPVYKVTYKHWFQEDTSRTLTNAYIRQAKLIGNSSKSLYIYNVGTGKLIDTVKVNYKNFQEVLDAAQSGKISGTTKATYTVGIKFDEYGDQILFEKQSDSIFSRIKMTHHYILVAEKNQKINWILSNEEKIIKGYNCKQATCFYRGRNYTAWFAPEIPIPEGPYKFKGLPGLILEIEDDRGELRIWAETIQYPTKSEIPSFMASGKPITFRAYLSFLGKEIEELFEASMAAEQKQIGYNLTDSKPMPKPKNTFCQIELTE
jgi:GLPGLI family protein